MFDRVFKVTLAVVALAISIDICWADSPKVTTVQVPEVVNVLKDKYGMPKDFSKVLPIGGKAPVQSLAQLIDLQRISFPQAWLTSTFYDYRAVSIYRRNPGLHLGYDIAMPAGAAVRVGWPGTVVSIAPWYTNQWGVTVSSSNGTEVTYGHIVPSVRVGDILNAGDVVGHISVDHVDVKMRDRNGNYIPFGEDGKDFPAGQFTNIAPKNSRESLMVGWLSAQNIKDTLDMELEMRQRELKLVGVNRDRLEERYATLHRQEVQMNKLLEEGIIAKIEAEKIHNDLSSVRTRLLSVKQEQKNIPLQISKIRLQLKQAEERLSKARTEAQKEGISWQEINEFVNGLVAKDKKLSKLVKDYKKDQVDKSAERRLALQKELREQCAKCDEYERLYEEGGLPRNELEAVKARIKAIKDELNVL